MWLSVQAGNDRQHTYLRAFHTDNSLFGVQVNIFDIVVRDGLGDQWLDNSTQLSVERIAKHAMCHNAVSKAAEVYEICVPSDELGNIL